MENNKVKFIADTMLGSLARWLRMLGYNTYYSRSFSDKEILELASNERRVILTRDWSLYRKALKLGLKAIYLENEDIIQKLINIARRIPINLDLDPNNSRCPICNGILRKAFIEEVNGKVPQEIIKLHDEFWICTKCGKIYWKGKHWITMRKILSEVKEKLKESD